MRRDLVVALVCGSVTATFMVWFAAAVTLFQGAAGPPPPLVTSSRSAPRDWRPGDWPPAGWRPADGGPR